MMRAKLQKEKKKKKDKDSLQGGDVESRVSRVAEQTDAHLKEKKKTLAR